MTISLSDLKAKRSAMSFGDGTRGILYDRVALANADGIVATHNAADVLIEIAEAALAADVLIEIAEAALAWDRAKNEKQAAIDALTAVAVKGDAEYTPAQVALHEAAHQVVRAKRDLLAALAKIKP